MEFEPLLSLHEPLGATVEENAAATFRVSVSWECSVTLPQEPAEIFSVGKGGKRNKRLEEATLGPMGKILPQRVSSCLIPPLVLQAALEDAKVAYRAKSKAQGLVHM